MAEAPTSPGSSSPDIFKDTSPPSKPEERWPALSQPSSSASSIQPAQKVPSLPASWTTKITQKSPMDYNAIRKKYEKYFQGNRILPIPELVQEVEPKIISYVVTDLKTKRLAGIKKDTFEGLLKAADIPAKYYCRRSFATWDVLLPSEDLAAKLAGENVISKYFRLQPEYMGRRKIRITVCNVPIQLNEEVLAAYLVKHGEIEDITKATSVNGTAHGDYIFTMCLDRGGFTAIPHVIEYEHQIMTVVVEGRKPQCWNCKQLGHFSKSCPQKTTKTTPATTTTTTETTTNTTNTTTTIAAAATAATEVNKKETPKAKTGDSPDKEEGWTQVVKGGGRKRLLPKNQPSQNQQILQLQTLTLSLLQLLLLLPQPNHHHRHLQDHHHHRHQQKRKVKKNTLKKKMKPWTVPLT